MTAAMNTVRNYTFESHGPALLHVKAWTGSVTVVAEDTTETTVEVVGEDADEVRVEQDGRRIDVVAPRRTGFRGGDKALRMSMTVPLETELAIRTASADVQATGTLGACEVKTGSGDVRLDDITGACLVESGSGDITIERATGSLRFKSGSGDLRIGHVDAGVTASSGSGDVEVGTSTGPAAVKTGSGDLRIADAHSDVSMLTASGDLVVGTARKGRVTAKAASGDIRVGIPAGTPVWTDITTVSGKIRSDLDGVGEPGDGVDHVELRATTISGDVVLTQV